MSTSRPISTARWLLLSELVAIFVSTSLAVGVEFLIYLTFISSPSLWAKLKGTWHQPMVRLCLAWGMVLLIAGLYCVGGSHAFFDNFTPWRKLLLLPLAAAVFDEDVWKNRLIHALILTASLGVALSYFSSATGTAIYKYAVGISIGNHSTQGMAFAASIFSTVMCLRFVPPLWKWYRFFLVTSATAIFFNLIFITDGRSGYLVLLVLTTVTAIALIPGNKKYTIAAGLTLGVALLLAFTPVARNRIQQGINEALNYEKSSELTSMGIRMAMWKNTLDIIAKRPVFGYGTGGFEEAYRRQVSGQTGWQGQPVGDPHNQFMRIVAEQGIFGLAVFLLFIGSFFLQQARGVYRILGLGILLAWCATSMFSAHFSTFAEGRFIYLWCGALLVPSGDEREEPEDRS